MLGLSPLRPSLLRACTTAGTVSHLAPGSLFAARVFSSSIAAREDVPPGSNLPDHIKEKVGKNLHLLPHHPLNLIRQRIYKYFHSVNASKSARLTSSGKGNYAFFDDLSPYVAVKRNFDDLLFPADHVGRSPSDTYYASGLPLLENGRPDTQHIPTSSASVLRTHTTAHQAEVLEKGHRAYIVTGDVYRRDEIDASHYPVFHQMDGACVFEGEELIQLGKMHGIEVKEGDRESARKAVEVDLKKTLEGLASFLFEPVALAKAKARKEKKQRGSKKGKNTPVTTISSTTTQSGEGGRDNKNEKEADLTDVEGDRMEMRWLDEQFPFTHPSWELEIMFNGKWMEVLGCGVIRQEILDNIVSKQEGVSMEMRPLGWAFGLGLERLAMILYSIPDIRLFWTNDSRFIKQFEYDADKEEVDSEDRIIQFQPYSKYPSCYKDVSFWLPPSGRFHENDFYEVVRGVAGQLVEEVECIDTFIHPKTGKESKCFRINFRDMSRSLTNEEVDEHQAEIRRQIVEKLDVELR